MTPTLHTIVRLLAPRCRRRWEHEATMVISHNPSRLPYWPVVATPEIGCFGRLRWINSDPSDHQAWGRVWWSNR